MNILKRYTIFSTMLFSICICILGYLGCNFVDLFIKYHQNELQKIFLSSSNSTLIGRYYQYNTTREFNKTFFHSNIKTLYDNQYNYSNDSIRNELYNNIINNIDNDNSSISSNYNATSYNVFNDVKTKSDNDWNADINLFSKSYESEIFRNNYMEQTFGRRHGNTSRAFLWITNRAGIFSQLLQIKIILSIAASSNRTALVTPILTEHFNNTRINVCDVFILPTLPYLKCVDEVYVHDYKNLHCMNGVNASTLLSDDYLVCVKGPLPLLGKFRNAREAVVSAANLPPALKLSHRFDKLIEQVKHQMNIGPDRNDKAYTVVHWRRGDQLNTRCKENKDNSVNCENSTSLVEYVRSYSNDSLVYVATNEHPGSKEYLTLKEANFTVFADTNINVTNSLEIFMIEVFLMLDASTFLGWGISEVNDVIEHERYVAKKSYCSAIHTKSLGQITWCDLQNSQRLENTKPQSKEDLQKKYKHDVDRTIVKRKKEHHHMHSRPSNFSASLNFTSSAQKYYNITKYNFSVEIDFDNIYSFPIRYNDNTKVPKILWWSASEGDIFTQFIQLKVKAAVANHYGRQLVLMNDIERNISLCNIFNFPSIISCTNIPYEYYCNRTMIEIKPSVLKSDIDNICYSGNTPNFGLDFNYANILSIILPLDLEFKDNHEIMLRDFKQLVGITDRFTVVSWDRSKEVLSLCELMARKDKAMSCRTAEDLRVAIASLSNDSMIYLSTNDDPSSNDLVRLREAGFKMLRNKYNQPHIEASSLDILILEYNLMIEATTFIGWKGSPMINLVEYYRSHLGKSHCIGREKHLVTEFVYCDYNVHELNTTDANTESNVTTTVTYSYRVANDVTVQTYLVAMANDNNNDNKYINDIIMKPKKTGPQIHQQRIHEQPQDPKTQPNSAFHQQPKTTQDHPGLDIVLSKTYASTQSEGKEMYWLNDQDGFFSQFLQLKVKFIVAQKFKRHLIIPPVVSYHFNNVPWSLCDVLVLPSGISCGPVPVNRTFTCETVLDISDLESDRPICYRGYLPLLGTQLRKESVMLAMSVPLFSFQLNPKYVQYKDTIKFSLGISENMPYTVVHWRRGDQLTTRCKGERDASVNCDNSTVLIELLKNQTQDKLVYIATNEKDDSPQVEILKNEGYKLFSHTNISVTNMLDMFIYEIQLMLDSTTFLAWGISEVNDVIEYERKKMNKTYCLAHEDSNTYFSFCESQNK